jgi:hypothetical protein
MPRTSHTKIGKSVFVVTTYILPSELKATLPRTMSLALIVFALHLAAAILRYLKNDGKIHLVVFNNLQLADGRRHRVLLRLSNLQRGDGSVELYLDCAQADSVRNLPRAFSGLTQNPESIELRTFQRKPQVGTREQFCKVENGLLWPKVSRSVLRKVCQLIPVGPCIRVTWRIAKRVVASSPQDKLNWNLRIWCLGSNFLLIHI